MNEIDKSQNNTTFYNSIYIEQADPETIEIVIWNLQKRIENYTASRDKQLDPANPYQAKYNQAAHYDSCRAALQMLLDDLILFIKRIEDDRDSKIQEVWDYHADAHPNN